MWVLRSDSGVTKKRYVVQQSVVVSGVPLLIWVKVSTMTDQASSPPCRLDCQGLQGNSRPGGLN